MGSLRTVFELQNIASCRQQSAHTQVCTYISQCFCQILTKFRVSRQILVRVPSIKFHENLSSGSRAATSEQTDGHT